MSNVNCQACKHCYCEPDDDFTCGHPDSGTFGLYVSRGPVAHCKGTKFQQHPLRNADGTLKVLRNHTCSQPSFGYPHGKSFDCKACIQEKSCTE